MSKRKTTHNHVPIAVNTELICTQLHLHSGVYKIPALNLIGSKAKVLSSLSVSIYVHMNRSHLGKSSEGLSNLCMQQQDVWLWSKSVIYKSLVNTVHAAALQFYSQHILLFKNGVTRTALSRVHTSVPMPSCCKIVSIKCQVTQPTMTMIHLTTTVTLILH